MGELSLDTQLSGSYEDFKGNFIIKSIDTLLLECLDQCMYISPNIYKKAGKLSVHYATFLGSLPYSCSVHQRAELSDLGVRCWG